MSTFSDDTLHIADSLGGVSPAWVEAQKWDHRFKQATQLRALAAQAWQQGATLRFANGTVVTPEQGLEIADAIERGDA